MYLIEFVKMYWHLHCVLPDYWLRTVWDKKTILSKKSGNIRARYLDIKLYEWYPKDKSDWSDNASGLCLRGEAAARTPLQPNRT